MPNCADCADWARSPPGPGMGLTRRRSGSVNSAPGVEMLPVLAAVRGGAATGEAAAGGATGGAAGEATRAAGAFDTTSEAGGCWTAGVDATDFDPGFRARTARSSPQEGQRVVPSELYWSQLPQTMPISSSMRSSGG